MTATQRKMHLGLVFNPQGTHNGGWRLPESSPEQSFSLPFYVDLARTAERGMFDFMFMPDTLALVPHRNPDTYGRTPPIAHLEPFTLLAALAAVTTHIGLAGSATTTYNPPYQVARILASLDHISGGRAAWNLITSANPAEAWNFGFPEHPDKADRYERAGEFADVVTGLWDSWAMDAFRFDKHDGQYFDPSGVRTLDHDGAHFKVKGPLNMARSPQGRPVIAQAGSSDAGRDLAARTAEVIFTAQQTMAGAKAFYDDVRSRASSYGRGGAEIAILPGVVPIVGRTDDEAQDMRERLQDAYDYRLGLDMLSAEFGLDMTAYPLDEAVSDDLPASPLATSRRDLLLGQAKRENLTLRQLAKRGASLGHWTLCGSAKTVTDTLQAWFEDGAADGFIVMPACQPTGTRDFVELVTPELQRRGLFRTAYESTTLRGNLGFDIPERR